MRCAAMAGGRILGEYAGDELWERCCCMDVCIEDGKLPGLLPIR